MKPSRIRASAVLCYICLLSFSFSAAASMAAPLSYNELKSIAQPFPEPQPGSWQYEQKEPGQTFSQYKAGRPAVATAKRRVIYVQILGRMSDSQKTVVDKAVEYLGLFYGLKTQTLPPLDASVVPISARRIHPMGQRQFNATYICEKVLLPSCPADAAAYIAFTAEDLFPAPEWNFCFGYALYKQRVGVWSLARNGNPDDPDEAKTVLRRTLRIASHEVGHMFSMRHCIAYKCNMNGVNSLEEADATPLYLCPECLRKLNYATKVDYVTRWRKLEKFYSENGLEDEAQFIRKCLGL
ncbi:MAG: hypothetical protein IJQ39_13910 [Thermoguttaceae bacterium]|nr:hypothetical protein [Thermoguttaceae bacterium]